MSGLNQLELVYALHSMINLALSNSSKPIGIQILAEQMVDIH